MKGSEFNHVQITNQTPKSEFVPVQRTEYSRNAAELGKTPDVDLNSSSIHNDSVEENTIPKTSKKPPVRHAGDAAKTVSTGAHAFVVGASVVATTVVATAAGIHVVNDANASATFTSFIVTDSSLSYSLRIDTDKEDSTYTVRVYNSDYDKSLEAHAGLTEGYFEGLHPNESYHVQIQDKLYISNILYDEVFYTKEEEEQSSEPAGVQWMGLVWDKRADFFEETITVQLNFSAEEIPYDSIFLKLEEKENPDHSYEFYLEHTLQAQVVSLSDVPFEWDYVHSTFVYTILAYEGEEMLTLEQGETKLEDNSGLDVLVGDPYISEYYSSSSGSLDIALDYKDPYGVIDEFRLTLTALLNTSDPSYKPSVKRANTGQVYEFALEKTRDTQQIDLSSISSDLKDIASRSFSISLSYIKSGEEVSFWGQDEISFIDIDKTTSEVSYFYIHDEADYETNAIQIDLEFSDEAGIYTSFYLVLASEEGLEIELHIEKANGTQAIVVAGEEGKPVTLSGLAWQYEFGYYDGDSIKHSLRTGETTFTYNEIPPTSSITSVTISEYANYLTGAFDVTVEYEDPENKFAKFYLTFGETGDFSLDLEFPVESGTQTLYFADDSGVIPLKDRVFGYEFGYIDGDGERNVFQSGALLFLDSAAGTLEVEFDQKANFYDNSFTVSYHFDDPYERISNVQFMLMDANANKRVFSNPDNEEGPMVCYCGDTSESDYIDLISGGPFEYKITYDYDGVTEILDEGSFDEFVEEELATFNGFTFDPVLSINDNYMYYHIDYQDSREIINDFCFQIEYNEVEYTWYINKQDSTGFLGLDYDGNAGEVPVDDFIGKTAHVKFTYTKNHAVLDPETITVVDEDVVFTREAVSKVHGARLISTEFNPEYPTLPVQFYYHDDNNVFSNMRMLLVDGNGKQYLYEIDSTLDWRINYQDIDLASCVSDGFDLSELIEQIRQGKVSLGLDYYENDVHKQEILLENMILDFI